MKTLLTLSIVFWVAVMTGQTKGVDKNKSCDFKINRGDGIPRDKDTSTTLPLSRFVATRLTENENKEFKAKFPLKPGEKVKLTRESVMDFLSPVCQIGKKRIVEVTLNATWIHPKSTTEKSTVTDFYIQIEYNFKH